MRNEDRGRFAACLTAAAEVYGKAISSSAAEVWMAALSDLQIEVVEAAMMRHMRDPERGQFMPKPADIIAQVRGVSSDDSRPTADEAFSMLPKSEMETAVWTPEMAQAWYAGAADLYETDRVGSRMAFRASYERLVERARRDGCPVSWTVTLGHDPRGREEPVRKAIEQGLLPASAAPTLLPSSDVSDVAGELADLLSFRRLG